jgi:hypothetical protein
MKTKNWKLTRNEDTWLEWEKKSNSSYYGDKEVSVAKMYSDKIIDNPIKAKYTWVVTTRDDGTDYYVFKTKGEAVHKAKSYMRRH